MSNLEKKEPLTALISIKTSERTKAKLAELAGKSKIEFSNYIRIILEEHIEKLGKSKAK